MLTPPMLDNACLMSFTSCYVLRRFAGLSARKWRNSRRGRCSEGKGRGLGRVRERGSGITAKRLARNIASHPEDHRKG